MSASSSSDESVVVVAFRSLKALANEGSLSSSGLSSASHSDSCAKLDKIDYFFLVDTYVVRSLLSRFGGARRLSLLL